MANVSEVFIKYLDGIARKYASQTTSEYGYRTEFETLLKEIYSEIGVKRIDHDAKSIRGNKPDFVVYKEVPIVYIEVKDIGVSLDRIEKSEQMSRYFGYDNLVLTDYIEFRFYRNGQRYQEPIELAKLNKKDRTLEPNPAVYENLANTLIDFTKSHKEPIKSGVQLAKIMGGKGQRIRDNVLPLLESARHKDEDLEKVYHTIKQLLVHDLKPSDFADMYAQTLVYGLFVARFYDESPKDFSRSEARDLIPASNPFLRHFFDHIAGPNFNKRLEHIVDELCQVYSHSDIEKLMDDYYKKDQYKDDVKGPDPIIHFYEDFLQEYDPALRKKMGAYYTPEPVVQFIVRSVDELLQKEFGLRGGLADTTKTEDGVHKVQVLDPAVGTGTFYSKVIGNIYAKFKKNKQEGRWPKYVHNDLLPRIHGFELMMAPYTIAHLKLSLAFKRTGFKYFNDRLGIYLTNSLEDIQEQGDLLAFGFAESIANESKEAAKIKKQTPIMVVLGNPPYSGISSNNDEMISAMIEDYKYVDGEHFKERKHWLNDDYVKFIRYAEKFIEKNGFGMIGYITPHGFIDNPTFRGMRWHLSKTFDQIFVLDLHGNTKKEETAPDGGKDENVFDIQQGVAISLLVKLEEKNGNKPLADIFHADLYGDRAEKFEFLNSNTYSTVKFSKVKSMRPYYFFVNKDEEGLDEYGKGIDLSKLFIENSTGVLTARDKLVVDIDRKALLEKIKDFADDAISHNEAREKYFGDKKSGKYKKGDTRGWKLDEAREKIANNNHNEIITEIDYRPFDKRFIYYSPDMVDWGRENIMNNLMGKDNIAILSCRQSAVDSWEHIGITDCLVDDCRVSNRTKERGYVYPLYVYSTEGGRKVNLNKEKISEIESLIGKFAPEDLVYYIYSILHSPTYRERYKEFLKIDFPRIPYPTDRKLFNKLVKVGKELRELHLMESGKLDKYITTYSESGSDKVEQVKYEDGKVWINDEQYFGNVPEVAWNFYIGGYQPAQKWLKDRKKDAITLSNEDIEHYQKIVVALIETDKLMKKIDEIVPKWPMK